MAVHFLVIAFESLQLCEKSRSDVYLGLYTFALEKEVVIF